MSKKALLIFFIILIVGVFFRLYRLADVPPGINRDEASIGYTAYSLLKTAKDEYGRFLPLSFQSFGDWKLPMYMYTTVPFVQIFGLSEIAVRLPSALSGIATLALTFFLVRLLLRNSAVAFLTIFLLAVSPWHLHLSRVESESNMAVMLTVAAVFLFFKSLKGKRWFIIPSAIFFALTYFTYAGNHIFTTVLLIGLIFIYRFDIPRTRFSAVAGLLFFSLFSIVAYHTLFGADRTKLSGIGIFGDPSVIYAQIELPRNKYNNPQSIPARLFHNRVVFAATRFWQNYINAFSPQFLFIKGGTNKAHNIEGFGNMYLIEAPFLFLGLIYLIRLKKSKEKLLILFWFFIAPIAASITKDAPHSNRMFAIFPMLPAVTAMGIYWVVNDLIKKRHKIPAVFLIAVLFFVNMVVYFNRYYVSFPRNEAASWGFSYKMLSDILITSSYADKFVIMGRPQYSPYIYLLFYQHYDPLIYQKTAVRYSPTNDGFVHVKDFDRYEFRTIDWKKDTKIPNTLLVDWTEDVPDFVKKDYKTREVFLPNNKSIFTIVETR